MLSVIVVPFACRGAELAKFINETNMKYLKQITWAVIFGVVSMGAPSVWAQAGAHTMVTPGDLKWVEVPSLPPGAKLAVVEGPLNEAVPFTFRLTLPTDYKIPAHWPDDRARNCDFWHVKYGHWRQTRCQTNKTVAGR